MRTTPLIENERYQDVPPGRDSLPLDAYISEMRTAFLIPESFRHFFKCERPIQNRTKSGLVQRRHIILLIAADSDEKSLQPGLFARQRRSRNCSFPASQNANECNMPSYADSLDGLRKRARPSDLNDMIDAAPICQFFYLFAPIFALAIIDRVISPEFAQALQFFIRRRCRNDAGSHGLCEL